MGGEKGPVGPADTGYPKLNFEPVGQKIQNIYQDRLRQFTSRGQYKMDTLPGWVYLLVFDAR